MLLAFDDVEHVADRRLLHADLEELLKRHDVNAFAASVKIYAVKPP